jgi:hypothetical protein
MCLSSGGKLRRVAVAGQNAGMILCADGPEADTLVEV